MLSKVWKGFYLILGTIALIVGIIGIFLPLIPTTPLVLLAAWCYYRSSKRLHDCILANKRFGKIIRNYQEGRGMTRSIKVKAVMLMWLAILSSIYLFVDNLFFSMFLLAVASIVSVYIHRQPTYDENANDQSV